MSEHPEYRSDRETGPTGRTGRSDAGRSDADDTYPAPVAAGPVRGRVRVPGSKSITNRELILAAIADGPGTIRGALLARDTTLMMDGLRALGVGINVEADPDPGDGAGRIVRVVPGRLHGPARVDCGLAGTVMRFLPPVAALAEGDVAFDGDARARQRPLAPVLHAMRDLGARISDSGRPTLPFTVHGRGHLAGGQVEIDASESSQFVSGLLLSAPRYDRGLVLRHSGPRLPSAPFVELTCELLRARGVEVTATRVDDNLGLREWRVEPGPIAALDTTIEPDLSNALPFLAAAMVTGGEVTIVGWPADTAQAGSAIPALLTKLGGRVAQDADGLTVSGPAQPTAVEVDLSDVGEITPTVAAICAVADGTSRLTGVAHLRGHETDRLAALVAELTRLGCTARELEDGIEITPGPMAPATLRTYHDHRMATFAAIIGLVVPGVLIENVSTTAKTMPHFTRDWERLVGTAAAAAPPSTDGGAQAHG